MSPRPPLLSGRKLVKIFEKLGYRKVSQKGSHIRYETMAWEVFSAMGGISRLELIRLEKGFEPGRRVFREPEGFTLANKEMPRRLSADAREVRAVTQDLLLGEDKAFIVRQFELVHLIQLGDELQTLGKNLFVEIPAKNLPQGRAFHMSCYLGNGHPAHLSLLFLERPEESLKVSPPV
jgi:hypothetical protein